MTPCRRPAVRADDLVTDLDLERLLEEPEVERPAQPQQRHRGQCQLGEHVDDRAGQVRRQRGGDEERGRQDDRHDRTAGDAQRRPIADRRAVAQPEGTDRRADGAGGHDRQGDRDGDDPCDPRKRLADRRDPAGEQVDRAAR